MQEDDIGKAVASAQRVSQLARVLSGCTSSEIAQAYALMNGGKNRKQRRAEQAQARRARRRAA